MLELRGFFQVFMLSLIFAVGANGAVMASNDVMHQKNCIHSAADQAQPAHAHQVHDGQHNAENSAAPEHDHETCMMHACSAIAYEALGAVEIPIFLSSNLVAIQLELAPLGLAESFLIPPNA